MHIDDIILPHVNLDVHEMENEIMDALFVHTFTMKDTHCNQLLSEGTMLVKFNLKPVGLTITFSSHVGLPGPLH